MAKLMGEACCNVTIEPYFQPLQSERIDNNSTNRGCEVLDTEAKGFWESRFTRAFIFRGHSLQPTCYIVPQKHTIYARRSKKVHLQNASSKLRRARCDC